MQAPGITGLDVASEAQNVSGKSMALARFYVVDVVHLDEFKVLSIFDDALHCDIAFLTLYGRSDLLDEDVKGRKEKGYN